MRIHNYLPVLLECLRDWTEPPSRAEFIARYFEPISPMAGIVFDGDGAGLHAEIVEFGELHWEAYRREALRLDPVAEEARLRRCMGQVERLFGIPLAGDAVLYGAFTLMDGYARFDRGSHRVLLGVDESHGRGKYLDVLLTHELTHVIRESRPEVWRGFGLSPTLSHDEFTENLPVIEHLFGEGFSCVVSEILNPGEDPWHYCYQSRESLARIGRHAAAVDRGVREELADGDYGKLYAPGHYRPEMPVFAHYAWAWQWARQVVREFGGGDPRKVVDTCSKEWLESALKFELFDALGIAR